MEDLHFYTSYEGVLMVLSSVSISELFTTTTDVTTSLQHHSS